MFSLVITVIAIALVAGLALATVYYGGSQFRQGGVKIEAAQVLSHATQIIASNNLYFTLNQRYITTEGLSNSELIDDASVCENNNEQVCFPKDYLSKIPRPSDRVTTQKFYIITSAGDIRIPLNKGELSSEVCKEINSKVGLVDSDGLPLINADPTVIQDRQYGCVSDNGENTFIFKG